MMKKFNFNTTAKAVFSAGLLTFALTGCGSDGTDGSDGEDGEVSVNIDTVTAIQTKVEVANYDEATNQLSLEFSLTNLNGVSVSGFETDEKQAMSVAFGRMGTRGEAFLPYELEEQSITSRGDADREIWLSYRNKVKNDLIAGSSAWKLSSCPEDTECLSYLGNGRYNLTIPEAINTEAYEYGYDATKAQGVYLITSGAGANSVKYTEKYYWDATAEQEVSAPKVVIMDQTCSNCHVGEDNIRHSSYGNTAEGCVFCHTDYTLYAGTGTDEEGNTVDFTYDGSIKGLVHAVHTGAIETDRRAIAKFESVINKSSEANPAFTYKFDGAILDDEGIAQGPLNFPASTSDCQSCHLDYTTTEETLPENVTVHALDAYTDADADSCQSCHGIYHKESDMYEETESGTSFVGCVTCHTSNEDGRGGAYRHFAGHNEAGRESAAEAGMLVESTYTNLNWDEATSVLSFTMNLTKNEEAVTSEFVPSVTIYVNAINAEEPDAFLASRTSGAVTENTDGSYLVTVDATAADYVLPSLAEAITSGADLAITSSFSTCFEDRSSTLSPLIDDGTGSMVCEAVASPNAAKATFLKLDGTTGAERTSAAAYENCANCHNNDMVVRDSRGTVSIHYRNADLHTCAQCHEAGDYNSMVVRVHGTYGKAHGREDVQNLVSSENCTACHSDTSYSLESARSTPMRWNRGDDTFSSPEAGVCASCHVSDAYQIGGGSASAEAHITNNGGVVAGSYEEAQMAQESCSTCHSASKIADVHGLN